MKRHLLIAAILCTILTTPAARGQFYIGLHGGVTLPQGYYAESQMSDNSWMFTQGNQHNAGAGTGWGAGLDISFAMPFHPSLELAINADYLHNVMSRDVREYYDIRYAQRFSQCSFYEMELPEYTNIPIMAGIRYAYPIAAVVDLYGEAMAGANIRKISTWSLVYAEANWMPGDGQSFDDYNNSNIKTYADYTTFAFRLGAGFLIKKAVTVGAAFVMLGKSPLVWDESETVHYNIYGAIQEISNTRHVDYYPINPTMVYINLGFRLNPFKGARHVQDW